MECEFFSDAGGLLDVAGQFLAEDEAENTVLLGHARRCVHRPRSDAVMAAVHDGDAVRLVAMMLPPHALVLSARGPDGVPCLVAALRAAGVGPPGVVGIASIAERFAALWRGRESPAAEAEMRTILYRADHIAAPGNVPGELRPASDHDLEWLAGWQRRFAQQASLSTAERAADMRAVVAARIARGEMYVWAVEGRPVASAAFIPTAPAGDAGRINAVFTLEEERGRGYASAGVAALSRRLLDRGWRYCLVFADRGNPITTRMYPRLGYQEVARFATIGLRGDR